MSIFAHKLVTGDEVIGETSKLDDGRLLIVKPVSIRMFPSQLQGGEPTMGFVPFPALCDPEKNNPLIVEPLHIVYSYEPYGELVESYKQMVTSQTTGNKQIITG